MKAILILPPFLSSRMLCTDKGILVYLFIFSCPYEACCSGTTQEKMWEVQVFCILPHTKEAMKKRLAVASE